MLGLPPYQPGDSVSHKIRCLNPNWAGVMIYISRVSVWALHYEAAVG